MSAIEVTTAREIRRCQDFVAKDYLNYIAVGKMMAARVATQ